MRWMGYVVVALLGGVCLVRGEATASKSVEKPEMVTREQWNSTPQPIPDARKHTPKYITVHHAGVTWKPGGDPQKLVKNMQGWGQKEKNWPDLPYHYLIAPDGRIFEGRSTQYEPESNTKYDLQGHIGVELMGNFEEQRASLAQLESLTKLVAWISQDLKIDPSEIATHKDRAKGQTTCPGKDLYRYIQDGQLQTWVKQLQSGQQPNVQLRDPLPDGPTVIIGEPLPEKPKAEP